MNKSIALLILSLFLTVTCYAKTADPKPLVKNGIEYSSHLNIVTATRLKDKKLLWKAVLPINPHALITNSNLEADIQMNIIRNIKLDTEGNVLAIFKAGQIFSIQIRSGEWKQIPSLTR